MVTYFGIVAEADNVHLRCLTCFLVAGGDIDLLLFICGVSIW